MIEKNHFVLNLGIQMWHHGKSEFFTRYHSNKNYINEIAIENKHTSKFYFIIGYYDQYVAQVIRSGNALSLLSNQIALNRDNFWNLHY